MANYPASGISEDELIERFVKLVRDFEVKKEQVDLYLDGVDEVDRLFNSNGNFTVKAKEIALENHREYLRKRIELRDAYMSLNAVYKLGREFFPNSFNNSRIVEHMNSGDFEKATSLDQIIGALIDEEGRQLDQIR